jgi:hypothetical protein
VQVGVVEPRLCETLGLACHRLMPGFSDIDLATLLWGFARMRSRQRWLLFEVGARLTASASELSPVAISNLLWAYGELEHNPGRDWLLGLLWLG